MLDHVDFTSLEYTKKLVHRLNELPFDIDGKVNPAIAAFIGSISHALDIEIDDATVAKCIDVVRRYGYYAKSSDDTKDNAVIPVNVDKETARQIMIRILELKMYVDGRPNPELPAHIKQLAFAFGCIPLSDELKQLQV